jgi:hypothetical protein
MRAKLLAVTLFAVGLTGYLRANLADAAVAPHVLSSSAQSADDPPTEVEIKPLFFAPKPADDGRPAFLPRTEELACNACHAEIVTEWASSMHAMAWVDERYQKAIARKSKPESCQGCHIPEPLFSGDLERKPAPRADITTPRPAEGDDALSWDPRHMGISCVSCHMAPDGAMLGPFASSPENEISDAHASRQDSAFVLKSEHQDALCISCHRTNVGPVIGVAKDYQVTDQANKGLSCVGCHYAPVKRSHAKGTDAAGQPWAAPVREGRSHALQTPRDPYYLALAFGLTAKRTEVGAELVIKNQAAHRVPGLRNRSMTFRVTARDADGQAIGQTEHMIASDNYLPVDEAHTVTVRYQGQATTLSIRATHEWEGIDEPVVFINQDLEL